ncbi:LLM class flavin-dependent oxidoreductase [Sphingobium sp. B2]|uniref:LLM class flavin-dependent oxidoreductase n=1 Tax=Sphingobium sp. B2 TaxID=2583228 RepID=UPI0011A473A4|nr:LLM class flavin-dependent oxidoreductase [Sphingobium sp. B2]
MKVNLGVFAHNSHDWDRLQAGRYDELPAEPDWKFVQAGFELGKLAEPLGFDGIWAPEHFGTPYGMSPNPLQMLTYFAGCTERITFGTMVAVAPWWHPVRMAHQIAYLDIISNGRLDTIGLGRGVAKKEFDALGIPREEARQRLDETLDILELAFSQQRFSYDGEIFKIPEMELRPAPKSNDLHKRLFGSASSAESAEMLARRGLTPLFVGNKPLEDAGRETLRVNTIRIEEGFAPVQPKNVMMLFCARDPDEEQRADEWLLTANRDVSLHYGFADPSNFAGVKGYEAYANRQANATAVLDAVSEAALKDKSKQGGPKLPGYHPSNLLIGTPDEIVRRIEEAQRVCSFSEITVLPQFGTMPYAVAAESMKLFAEEVLPHVQKMAAPLHPTVVPSLDTAE